MKKTFTLIGAALLGLTTVGCQQIEEQKLTALSKLGTAAVRLAMHLVQSQSTDDALRAEAAKESMTASSKPNPKPRPLETRDAEPAVRFVMFDKTRLEARLASVDTETLHEVRVVAAKARAEARLVQLKYELKLDTCPKRSS